MASLFDTGAFERLCRGERESTAQAIHSFPAVICLHIASEYLYGAIWARANEEDLMKAIDTIEKYEVLQPTLATASIYARLRVDARRAGRQMPDADFWIAAHAIEEGMLLVTMDNHFTFFNDLRVHLLT